MGIAATIWNISLIGYSISTKPVFYNAFFYVLILAFDVYMIVFGYFVGRLTEMNTASYYLLGALGVILSVGDWIIFGLAPIHEYFQIDYVKYCDGKIASEEPDKEIRSRLNHQIYSMMKKEEGNFLIYSFQINDKIYGICNVYSQCRDQLTLCTDDLDYSFSFSYDENKDKPYKVNQYANIELIYEDEYNCP